MSLSATDPTDPTDPTDSSDLVMGAPIPVRKIFDAFPGADRVEVEMGRVRYTNQNLDPTEQFALGAICQLRRPRRIFEFGTYNGASTLILAANAPAAEVFTLDLPDGEAAVSTVEAERANLRGGGRGERFQGRPEAARITQLLGDSTRYDLSPWAGTIDLVLVDAGHEWEAVWADTQSAQRLLAPGGVIVWDDYMPYWPAVMQAVQTCGLEVFQLDHTDFAVHDAAA